MEKKKNEMFKIIFLGISIIVLILFIVFAESMKKNNENQDIENNINSNTYVSNDIDKNNFNKIPGYNNLYQYEIDLETY